MDGLALARAAAQTLRSQWLADHPATRPTDALPVLELIAAQDVEIIRYAPQDYPGTLGFLDPNEDVIWLGAGQPAVVERFTLGHELGHWCLHRRRGPMAESPPSCAAADLAPAGVLRPEEAYSERSQCEREANAFAAELLAPLALVHELFITSPPAAIADRLGVSAEVITRQILQLLLGTPATPSSDSLPVAMPRGTEGQTLDASQQMAVTVDAPALIVAGPGTGKTSTLVGRVRWLVEQGLAAERILALTFSRKAAGEMRERIAATLGATAPQPTVATFHRFGVDLLRRYGQHVGLRPDFRLIDEIGAFWLLRDLAPSLPLNHYLALTNPTRHFGDLLGAIARAKDELVNPQQYAVLAEQMAKDATNSEEEEAASRANEVAAVYAAYQAELTRRGDADYGDLVMLAVRLLEEQAVVRDTVRAQYTQIVVDEFQDINRANGVLLRTLAGPAGQVWAVGDANQAIYRFRGASPANITRFHEDYPGARVVALAHNYRSRPAIVAAANRFAASALGQSVPASDLQPTRSTLGEPTVMLNIAPDGDSEVANIAAEIVQRRQAGTPYQDQAVLCRTRAQARHVTEALQAAGIPAEVRTDLFDDEVVKDILGVPQLLAGVSAGLVRAARVAEHALSVAGLLALLAAFQTHPGPFETASTEVLVNDDLASTDRQAIQMLREIIPLLRLATSAQDMLMQYCFTVTGIGRRALLQPTVAAHLGDLLLLAGRFDEERPRLEGEGPQGRWLAFVDYLQAIRGVAREAGSPTDGDDVDSVPVLTVHGAKGLEWPVVYLPFLATRRFPIQRHPDGTPTPPGLVAGAGNDPAQAHLEEEACLFYVALTRARDTLILSRAVRYSPRQASSASPFLAPVLLDPDVVTTQVPGSAAEHLTPESPVAELIEALAQRPAPASVTASALETYDRCPRQYAFRYGLQLTNRLGTYGRLRRALAATLRANPAEWQDAEQALVHFERQWDAAAYDGLPDPFAPLFLRYGREAVARGFHQWPRANQPHGQPDERERAIALVMEDIAIQVELDQITTPSAVERVAEATASGGRADGAGRGLDGPPAAVRHRLGRRKTAPDPDLRSLLFVLAQRALAGDAQAATILEHQLEDGRVIPVTLGPRDEARLHTRLRTAVAGLRAGHFPTNPDPTRCAACDFALICEM